MAAAVLYKSLVEPNHINCHKIEEAVKHYLRRAERLYGKEIVAKIGEVFVEFFDKGRNAAMALVGQDGRTMQWIGVVQFSMRQVIKNFAQMMKQIVPHEVAHLICFANGWDLGHGDVWRKVCQDLGGNGETKNNFATIDGRLKNLYEAASNDASYWLTGKQMRMAASSGIVVKDERGLAVTLTKHSLTGNVKKL